MFPWDFKCFKKRVFICGCFSLIKLLERGFFKSIGLSHSLIFTALGTVGKNLFSLSHIFHFHGRITFSNDLAFNFVEPARTVVILKWLRVFKRHLTNVFNLIAKLHLHSTHLRRSTFQTPWLSLVSLYSLGIIYLL